MGKKGELELFVEGLVEKEIKESELGEAIEEGVLDWAKEKMGKMKGSKTNSSPAKQKSSSSYQSGSVGGAMFRDVVTELSGGKQGTFAHWASQSYLNGPAWMLKNTGSASDGKQYSTLLAPQRWALPRNSSNPGDMTAHQILSGSQEEGWLEILNKDFSPKSTEVQAQLTPLGLFNYLKSSIPHTKWMQDWDPQSYDIRAAISRSRPRK